MSESPVPTPAAGFRPAATHFTWGNAAICGRVEWPQKLAFDETDRSIDCPLCAMYLQGLRAGRAGLR